MIDAPRRLRQHAAGVLTGLITLMLCAAAGLADPPTDYMLHCRGCHGPEGGGARGAAPPFRDQLGKYLWVPGGREYLIRVPGTSQSELSDARTAALLNWMLRAFSPDTIPPGFERFDAEEVSRYRHPPLVDVDGVRRQLLGAIRLHDAAGAAATAAPATQQGQGAASR